MAFVLTFLLVGVVVTLVAWVLSRFVPGRRSDDVKEHRPNVIFWFVGSLTFLVGLVLLVAGAVAVADVEDTFHGTGPEETADGASLFTWGAVVLVNGAYVWRGARRRGFRDRFGRLLIIVGYVVLGVAMSSSLHNSVELWGTTTEEAGSDVLNRTMLGFLGWGVPAACLVALGCRIAPEKVLLTAQASAHSG
jgi:hypothetical protein